MIYFLTGNRNKLQEVQAVMPDVEGWDVDLPEVQEIDAEEIISVKLNAVESDSPVMVEDTSFYMEAMNGLPGPLVKWFLKTVGAEGLYQFATCKETYRATAETLIGYRDNYGQTFFTKGTLLGTVVAPRGENGIGWDVIFQPDGYEKTIAEMTPEEKQKMSMRTAAVNDLREQLEI